MTSAIDEEAIIKKRWFSHTTISGARVLSPFEKLTKRYLEFCKLIESGSLEEAERTYGELLSDLYSIQFHMRRLNEMGDAFRREQELYVASQEQLQASIAKAAEDIEQRKRQLQEARVELKQKQEYEVLKKQVVSVPARSATQSEMEAVEREILDMQAQAQQLDVLFERRKRQFSAVAGCLQEVQLAVEGETPEEGEEGGGALGGDALEEGALPGGARGSADLAKGTNKVQQQQQQGKQNEGVIDGRGGKRGVAPMQLG